MARYELIGEIIAHSIASTWEDAKAEWHLLHIHRADKDAPGTCLCGQHPILDLCVLENRRNGNQVVVGNVCVKKFMGLPSDKIFAAPKRIASNIDKSLNAGAIEHVAREGWLSEWETNFYLDICRKRNLTFRQLEKRAEINQRILRRISVKPGDRSNASPRWLPHLLAKREADRKAEANAWRAGYW
jgi:hypothetical protein